MSVYNEYLAHYGIKGQKWGIRRYQNEDGSYTDLGRRLRNAVARPKSESSTWKAKDAGSLSDDELRRRLTRLQQEKQYKEMTASRAAKARKWISKTAGKILVTTAIGVAASVATYKYKSMAEGLGVLPSTAAKVVETTADFTKKTRGQW